MSLPDEDRRLLRAIHDKLVGAIGDETPGGLLGRVARQDDRLEALEEGLEAVKSDVGELLEERRRGGPASPPGAAPASPAPALPASGALAAGGAPEAPAEIPTPLGPLRLPRSWRLPVAFALAVVALELGREGLRRLVAAAWKALTGG